MSAPWRSPFPRFGAGVGLARTLALAARLELDLAAFGPRSCVITGSNGKGSTAAMTAAILAQQLSGVGLFTSPHLISVRERIALDGAPIPEAQFAHWARVAEAAARAHMADEPNDQVSAFEHLFLTAALWFRAERSTAVVWEAGIGGRHDPTRLVRAKRTALTSVDLEHTALLGGTLDLIGQDKIDACAPGGVVLAADQPDPLRRRLETYARLQGVRLTWLAEDSDWRLASPAPAIDLRLSSGQWVRAAAPLAGRHQVANAALAARLAVDMLAERFPGGRGDGDGFGRAVVVGLKATRWPGRLETVAEAPTVVIDVGHTPAATAAANAGFWEMGQGPATLLCAASADKDARALLAPFAGRFKAAVVTEAPQRARPAGEAAAVLAALGQPQVEAIVDPAAALARARAMAGLGGRVLVGGSLFLAAAVKALCAGLNPHEIDPG